MIKLNLKIGQKINNFKKGTWKKLKILINFSFYRSSLSFSIKKQKKLIQTKINY